MLSLAKLAAGAEGYYLNTVASGTEEYYLGAGEAPGVWLGSACAELGLAGDVDADDLRAVLSGSSPDGERLARSNRRVPGFDLTFSAPKSISLLHALGVASTAAQIVEAHEAAVAAAVGYLEREACQVRRGHDGIGQQQASGFVAAGFRHRTSREGDPQLHTHLLVSNLGRGEDGRWSALDARQLYRHQKTAGYLYQAQLRIEIGRRLGLEWGETHNGMAELAGIPRHVLRVFSRRRRQIEARLAKTGHTSRRAAEVAALDTRTAKKEGGSHRPVDEWWQMAMNAGWTPADLDTLTRDARWAHKRLTQRLTRPFAGITHELLGDALTDKDSTFTRQHVLRALAATAVNGADVTKVTRAAEQFVRGPVAVEMADGTWSTTKHLEIERLLLQMVDDRRDDDCAVVADEVVGEAIAAKETLSSEQEAMVRRLTTAGHGVDVVVGHPGSGKTYALAACKTAWAKGGYDVIGTALAARAARNLAEEAGIPSQTLASLLTNGTRRRLDDRTVIVLDEAGMVGTRQLAQLITQATLAGCKVVLVGDHRQLPEIDAGGAFRLLVGRLGAIALTENRRQREPVERAALLDLRNGRASLALQRFESAGHVTTAESIDEARLAMVSRWWTQRSGGSEVVMLAHRRVDVAALNELAQDLRLGAAQLAGEPLHSGGRTFYVGDEIMFLRNNRSTQVLNGERATVTAIVEGNVFVRLANGRTTGVPAKSVGEGHIQLGYASTIHKAQGATVDASLVLVTDGVHLEAAYTALSRGRDENHLFAALDPADSPLEETLERSAVRTMAIEIGERRLEAELDHGVEL